MSFKDTIKTNIHLIQFMIFVGQMVGCALTMFLPNTYIGLTIVIVLFFILLVALIIYAIK